MSDFPFSTWEKPSVDPESSMYHAWASAIAELPVDGYTVLAVHPDTAYRYCELVQSESTVRFITDPNGALAQLVSIA